MKRFLMLLALTCSMFAEIHLNTPAWITGTGVKTAFAAQGTALSMDIIALPTNPSTNCSASDLSNCPVFGDTNIATGSRGFFLLPGAAYHFEMRPQGQTPYALADHYYICPTGAKVAIQWVN